MLQQGAKLVSSYQDVLEELNLNVVAQQIELPLDVGTENDDEAGLLQYLDEQPRHIDDITKSASLPIAAVSSMLTMLTMLELKGKVKQVGCMHYVLMQEKTAIYGN